MRIEELDWGDTPWGAISLRRRWDRVTERDVHEAKFGDDFLMSSQFTTGERELARIGLAAVTGTSQTVLVCGLGLGYIVATALEDDRVAELTVVEALQVVISWLGLRGSHRPHLRRGAAGHRPRPTPTWSRSPSAVLPTAGGSGGFGCRRRP